MAHFVGTVDRGSTEVTCRVPPFSRSLRESPALSEVEGWGLSAGGPDLILQKPPQLRVPRSFAFVAKGRESEMPVPSGFDHTPQQNQMADAASPPTLAKNARMGTLCSNGVGKRHQRLGHPPDPTGTRAAIPARADSAAEIKTSTTCRISVGPFDYVVKAGQP